jgi:hypothetical protein
MHGIVIGDFLRLWNTSEMLVQGRREVPDAKSPLLESNKTTCSDKMNSDLETQQYVRILEVPECVETERDDSWLIGRDVKMYACIFIPRWWPFSTCWSFPPGCKRVRGCSRVQIRGDRARREPMLTWCAGQSKSPLVRILAMCLCAAIASHLEESKECPVQETDGTKKVERKLYWRAGRESVRESESRCWWMTTSELLEVWYAVPAPRIAQERRGPNERPWRDPDRWGWSDPIH